ncbi:MAG: amino acid adenylation domain-containing protein, partial [Lysobacter sp.]
IEYLGRNDFQVKIRGFRIELGEIEARLAQYPGMYEVAVLAREDRAGDKRLVAYFSAAAEVDLEALRKHLGETLPQYMVPSAYVAMPRMPLTANGKLDRKALPAPDAGAYLAREYEAPVGPVETALAQIWADVLKHERVGRNDNFFALGGHSLLLMTLIERMRRIGLQVDVRALFAAPTLQALALEVGGERVAPVVPPNLIAADCVRIEPSMLPLVALQQTDIDSIVETVPGGAANIQDIYPLAPLQEGFLFHYLLESQGDVYLTWTLLSTDSRERLDRYAHALQQVIDRHDILRTGIVWDGLPEPVQVVWRQARLEVVELQFDPVDGPIDDQLAARFDPRHYRIDIRQAPLWKLFVARDEANARWVVLELIHHLIDDHTTIEFVNQEIQAIVEGQAERLPTPQPFRDFVAQTRLGVSREEHESFFRGMLGDVDEPTAPFGLIDTQGDGSQVAETLHALPAALSARLRACARAAEVIPAALCHLAWAMVLARASGRDDVVFGTVMLGRLHSEGAQRGMGVFINTLPLRVRVGAEGARDGVRRTHRLLTELLRHEHTPLNLTQRCSAVRPPLPLFSSLLNYRQDVPSDLDGDAGNSTAQAWNGMQLLRDEERSNYPFDLSINDRLDGGFELQCQIDRSAASPERICAMLETALESLADALERAPDTALYALGVLPPAERRQVLETWNRVDAEALPARRCVQSLFEAQVANHPQAIAVVHDGREIDYDELNRRANRLAHRLIASGLKPDDRVAIYMERSAEMVTAILATLKAGGAYVPLDPAYPPDRLEYMLGDVKPHTVLTQSRLRAALPATAAQVLELDGDQADAAFDNTNPDPVALGLRPEHLAYVIYTSGSTGLPKGVMIEHQSLVTLVRALEEGYGLMPEDRLLQFAALSFDMSVEEYFGALCSGSTLVLRNDDWIADPATFWRHCADHRISVLNLPTAFWHQLADERGGAIPSCVRQVMIGGEKVNAEMVARWFQRDGHVPRLLNAYGPTEATVDATICVVDGDPASQTSIGKPILHTRVYILDAQLQPVPAGVAGELYIGGAQVARGYLNREQLTAERFLADPFAAGGRMYKTGDLGRWCADGSIEYLGRNDFQVKIRGFRIELGEIESRLAQFPGVREAVVAAREAAAGDQRLVGYVEAEEGVAIDTEALRAHLAATLPAYMVPVAYVVMARMPLTANGKLDRKALPEPDSEAYRAREYEAPIGATESLVAQAWADLLKLDRIGRNDNFFELGGHSLLAVTLLSRLRRALAVEISLKDLFAHPLLSDLAAHLQTQAHSEQQPILPASRENALPLSYAQQRLWFFGQLDGGSEAYHIPLAVRLSGSLDIQALQRALDRVVWRHEVLRTTFERENEQTVQRIAAADSGFDLRVQDLRGQSEARVQEQLDREVARRFDLRQGPLVRGLLLRIADDEHVLAITLHHIVSDGWSMGVLSEELSALYAAYLNGEDDPLPPLPIQYADYAVWQRQWLDGEVLHKQSDYWREALSGAPALLELPTDRPRPAQQSFAGDVEPIAFDEQLTRALKQLAQRHGATLYMTVLAAWMATLSWLTGQDDVVVGTAVANRMRTEVEGLMGFFVNTQALRARVGGSVAGFLQQVRERVLEAQDHQDLPFERVVEIVNPQRSLAYASIFQVMLAWQNNDEGELALPGVRATPMDVAHTTAKFDLGLDLAETDGRIVGHLEFATALFDRATAQRYVGYLRRMLEAMAADERAALECADLLGEDERRQLLVEWNRDDARPGADACIHELFQAQVARAPDAIAVSFEDRQLSYGELNRRANRLAHHLIGLGVRPDDRVAICVERGLDMLVAVLAVLKAGGAYVPLDPVYPTERIAYMLGDSAPVAVLVDAAARGALGDAAPAVPVLDLVADAQAWSGQREDDPNAAAVGLSAQHLAYIIYTSGSTGAPKGVMIEHANVVRLFECTAQWFDFDDRDVWTLFHSFAFDFSVWEIWGALLYGGRLVVVPYPTSRSPDEFYRLLCEQRVTVLNQTPSAFNQLIAAQADSDREHCLRQVVFGGEALELRTLAPWYRRNAADAPQLVNMYGITETTVHVTYHALQPDDLQRYQGRSPIGARIPDLRTYILDPQRRPAPIGATGELYVGGAGVARGYLNRAELTEERFIADPFVAGARLYKTGDLGRWRSDGTIEYLGRNDFQVKIRGFR